MAANQGPYEEIMCKRDYIITLVGKYAYEIWESTQNIETLVIQKATLERQAKKEEVNVLKLEANTVGQLVLVPLVYLKSGSNGRTQQSINVTFTRSPVRITLLQGRGPVTVHGFYMERIKKRKSGPQLTHLKEEDNDKPDKSHQQEESTASKEVC